jgi:hypothetical protein
VSKQVVAWNSVQMQQYCRKQLSKHLYGIEFVHGPHDVSLQQWAPAAFAVPGASVAPKPISKNVPSRLKNLLRLELSVWTRAGDGSS